MSDKQFFGMVNLDYTGLAKVKAAVGAGDMQAAKHEFAEYLRHREKPVWNFDWRARPRHDKPPADVGIGDADRILQRDLPSVGVYHKFGGEIDWTLNPIDYREWPWQLNRHQFWVTLGRAYWATGDEKYAREFVYQMTDWVKKCPVPLDDNGNKTETWRTIEAGIRMGHTWLEAYHLFLTSPSFTDDAMVTMVESCVEHAQHLMRWPTTGNWLTMEANGLMHVGVMFPEFADAAKWRKTASDRLYVELDKQVYPDGAQIELSTGYHQVSLLNFIGAWQIAHLNGVAMPKDYVAKLERMFDYDLEVSMPDGCLPGLNDAGRTNVKPNLKQGFEFFPERKDYLWVSTLGKEGTKPVFRDFRSAQIPKHSSTGSIALPFSGHLVMRSGWEANDLYSLFDAGPFGYGHQHEDALSFVIYAYGKYMLVDPGNYPYDSSEWRKYVLSTRAHNTIMVDGLDQHRRGRPRLEYVIEKPLPIKWASDAKFDYAVGTYDDGYGSDNAVKVKHERHVFFVKPEYWIVTDFLSPSDSKEHRYSSMFHLDVSGAEVDTATKSVRTTDPEGANLTILPLPSTGLTVSIVSGQEKPVVQGWIPAGGYKCRPIPTPIFEVAGPGLASMAYVLYPTASGKKCPIVSVEPLHVAVDPSGVTSGMKITFGDGRVDYFAQTCGPVTECKFGSIWSDGQAVYVRTEGGTVTQSMMAGGRLLLYNSQRCRPDIVAVKDLSDTTVRHKF